MGTNLLACFLNATSVLPSTLKVICALLKSAAVVLASLRFWNMHENHIRRTQRHTRPSVLLIEKYTLRKSVGYLLSVQPRIPDCHYINHIKRLMIDSWGWGEGSLLFLRLEWKYWMRKALCFELCFHLKGFSEDFHACKNLSKNLSVFCKRSGFWACLCWLQLVQGKKQCSWA